MATKFNMPDELSMVFPIRAKHAREPNSEAINTGSSSRHLGAM